MQRGAHAKDILCTTLMSIIATDFLFQLVLKQNIDGLVPTFSVLVGLQIFKTFQIKL